MLSFLLLNTVGEKLSPTPKGLYSIVIVTPPAPEDWGTGIGNSPPARKLALFPLKVIRVGSARTFSKPCSFKASINTVHGVPWLEKRTIALTDSEMPPLMPVPVDENVPTFARRLGGVNPKFP